MPSVTLSKGESLVKLLSKVGLIVDTFTGIWLLEKGSLQKIASKNPDTNYSVLNIYSQGDYLMGDSDLNIDYVAIEDSLITQVSLNEIDPIQLLYQIDSIEGLVYVNSFKLEEDNIKNTRFVKFLIWAGRRLGKSCYLVPSLLNQSDMGSLIGATRVTVNRKLQQVRKQLCTKAS